jgi:hypothetical protein
MSTETIPGTIQAESSTHLTALRESFSIPDSVWLRAWLLSRHSEDQYRRALLQCSPANTLLFFSGKGFAFLWTGPGVEAADEHFDGLVDLEPGPFIGAPVHILRAHLEKVQAWLGQASGSLLIEEGRLRTALKRARTCFPASCSEAAELSVEIGPSSLSLSCSGEEASFRETLKAASTGTVQAASILVDLTLLQAAVGREERELSISLIHLQKFSVLKVSCQTDKESESFLLAPLG